MSVDNEFLLSDRIAKIRAINKQYNLLDNAYISFSGGKDSTILHYLMDEALPGNQIPRVFINTGIEYKLTLKFVKQMAENDNRFVIWTVGKDIKKTLNKVALPLAQLLITAHADTLPTTKEFENLADWLVKTGSDQLASYVLDIMQNVFGGMLRGENTRKTLFVLHRKYEQ